MSSSTVTYRDVRSASSSQARSVLQQAYTDSLIKRTTSMGGTIGLSAASSDIMDVKVPAIVSAPPFASVLYPRNASYATAGGFLSRVFRVRPSVTMYKPSWWNGKHAAKWAKMQAS